MMVRVQKSKEDGLDFSLALSLFIFCSFDGKDIRGRRHRRFLVLSLSFLSGHSLGSDGSLLFLSRAKKKKKKVVFAHATVGRRRLHAISPFSTS